MPILLPQFPVHIAIFDEFLLIFSERFSGEMRRELFSLYEKSGSCLKPYIGCISDERFEKDYPSGFLTPFHCEISWFHPDILYCEIEFYYDREEGVLSIEELSHELARFFAVDHGINCEVSDRRVDHFSDGLIPVKKATETETTEITVNPEEQLALKLGFKTARGKGNITALKEALLNIVLMNSDNINDISQVDKAFKLYTSNGVAKRNRENSQKALQKIDDAIKDCLENNIRPTKTLLNKKYGINYNLLKSYMEQYPDKLPK